MSAYAAVKSQLQYVTGRQQITCPHCGSQHAAAHVGGQHKVNGRYHRNVRTACRSCGGSYSFVWYRNQ